MVNVSRALFLLLLNFFACSFLQAQTDYHFKNSIPFEAAQFLSSDEFGNAYIVTGDQTLWKYQPDKDSTLSFNRISFGELKSLDASNPLRLLLFYQKFSKIVVLDNMLSPKREIELKKMNLWNVAAMGHSADGNIWVYDESEAKLFKINDLQQKVIQSNDLRQESNTVPSPQSLVEKEGIVYLCDSLNGIYTFDRQGRFLNLLPLRGIQKLQVIDDQIIFFKEGQLFVYQKKTFQLNRIQLPEVSDVLDVRVERERLFLLFSDRLDIFYTHKQ